MYMYACVWYIFIRCIWILWHLFILRKEFITLSIMKYCESDTIFPLREQNCVFIDTEWHKNKKSQLVPITCNELWSALALSMHPYNMYSYWYHKTDVFNPILYLIRIKFTCLRPRPEWPIFSARTILLTERIDQC